MGERMKTARAAAYQEFQCRSHERELERGDLFSRTTGAFERTFACVSTRPRAELEKAKVLVMLRGGGVVAVIHGNEEVACVAPGDADDLAQAISDEPLCAGMAVAVVEEASSITPELVLRLVSHAVGAAEDDQDDEDDDE